MRKLIKNGLIYDGSGRAPFKGDILLEQGKIAQIGQGMEAEDCLQIQADHLVITPGFVDVHRHCDYAAIGDETFGAIELAQGITTVCGGNCGLSISPSAEPTYIAQYDYVEPCIGAVPKEQKYESFSKYLKAIEDAKCPLHVGSLIGMGAVKAAVKGYGKSPFTKKELAQAMCLLQEGLEAGALGISMGIMYQPECYSTKEEMLELLRVAKPYGRPIAVHMRGEGDSLLSSVREVVMLSKQMELPVQISHFKATGCGNFDGLICRAIEEIDRARQEGVDVTVDFYPYSSGATTLLSLLPLCYMEDTVEDTLRKLKTAKGRGILKDVIYEEQEGWDNMVTSIGWEKIVISSVRQTENQIFCGKDMAFVARQMGGIDPCDAMSRLLLSEDGKVGIRLRSMSKKDVELVAKLPYSMLISDALYGSANCPHPRLYGAFPKFLREFVREKKIITMEEAVKKMTKLPAERFGISKRGMILEGYYGDLNLFDPNLITDRATYERPLQFSEGIAKTFVDGEMICENGCLQKRVGQTVIRASES